MKHQQENKQKIRFSSFYKKLHYLLDNIVYVRTKQKNRKNGGINFTTIDSGLPKQKKNKIYPIKLPSGERPSVELLEDSVADELDVDYALSWADIQIILKIQ